MKTKHTHIFKPGRGSVDVCACGQFRHNEKAGPAIVEVRTSAKWKIAPDYSDGNAFALWDEHGNYIPELMTVAGMDKAARIMESAPELLAALIACEDLLADLEKGGAENPELEIARAALAKAKG